MSVKTMLETLKSKPDMPILADDTIPEGLTRRQVNILSGKVYAYLKGKGIGKEDFVMICLPRGVKPVVAFFGVWRAGAAFVLTEDTMPPERIAFIKKDCGCKLTIDSSVWEEIEAFEPLDGYEETDDHNAAFAIYTSGTTGTPKGVLHEYGNLQRNLDCISAINATDKIVTDCEKHATVAPLSSVASQMVNLLMHETGMANYIVSYATFKNPKEWMEFLIRQKITISFIPPSYLQILPDIGKTYLRSIIVGGEPIKNLYIDGATIFNLYSLSEANCYACIFKIDKSYPLTPIGVPQFDLDIRLLDENGNDVPDGEDGELCFENPYFRGYINLPEETKRVFTDGWYHTGDLAKKLPDGNYVVRGRLSDMIKVNGNRVEPAEIEVVTNKILGTKSAVVKGVTNGENTYICLYYTEDIEVDAEKTRQELQEYLPDYMLPSHFIHIDKMPLRPSGKVDRKALPDPDISEYIKEYEAPVGETEKALCNAFQEVLKVERVGRNDSFYQLGGDSLGAIEVLVKSNLTILDASDIFTGATPKGIAELYKNKKESRLLYTPEADESARKEMQKLLPFQSYMFSYELHSPGKAMYNVYLMFKVDKKVFDMAKLSDTVYTVIQNHPSLCTQYCFDEKSNLMQAFRPEDITHSAPEKISEEEFNALKDGLIMPYKLLNTPLCRYRIFETEKAGYLFFDAHHSVLDGTSVKIFLDNILRAYYGESPEHDYYYAHLKENALQTESEQYEKSKKYFEENYSGDYSRRPIYDYETEENTVAYLTKDFGISDEKIASLKYASKNTFFMLSTLLAVAVCNDCRDVMITWTYNGRDNVHKLSGTGLLIRDIPVKLELSKNMTLKETYADIKAQIAGGIENCIYPHTTANAKCVADDLVCFLYQENIRNFDDLPEGVEWFDINRQNGASQNALDIEICNKDGGTELFMEYASSLYKEESMERFSELLVKSANSLLYFADKANVSMSEVIQHIKES